MYDALAHDDVERSAYDQVAQHYLESMKATLLPSSNNVPKFSLDPSEIEPLLEVLIPQVRQEMAGDWENEFSMFMSTIPQNLGMLQLEDTPEIRKMIANNYFLQKYHVIFQKYLDSYIAEQKHEHEQLYGN